MVVTPYTIFIWVTGIIIGSLSITVYRGSKRLSSRAFALAIFWVMVWSLGVGTFESGIQSLNYTLLQRFNYYIGTIITSSFLYFFSCLSRRKKYL